jgi:hypothetical protein
VPILGVDAFSRSSIRERADWPWRYVRAAMAGANEVSGAASEKGRRREARAIVGAYHQEQLRILLEHVRDGFAQLDAGEIDEFELDDLIHRYTRAARKLWSFCGSSGSQWLRAATALEYMRDRGAEHDWWAESARSRDRG